jgi:hypothetical protein
MLLTFNFINFENALLYLFQSERDRFIPETCVKELLNESDLAILFNPFFLREGNFSLFSLE